MVKANFKASVTMCVYCSVLFLFSKATLRNPFGGSPSSHGSSIYVGYPLIGSF